MTMSDKDNCEECGENNGDDEYAHFFNKNICYRCSDKYCSSCKVKLNSEHIGNDCDSGCGSKFCDNCETIECDICDEHRCLHCYGAVIELCCDCGYCCVSCLMFIEDSKLSYCKVHKRYHCHDCVITLGSDKGVHDIVKDGPTVLEYYETNADNFIPNNTKYTNFMVRNPGYRGHHFM